VLALVVLVLALGAADPGMPYAPLPGHRELAGLSDRLARDLRAPGTRVVRDAAVCADDSCARRAGQRRGADAVVYGTVLRAMAMIWSTTATVVDVKSGRSRQLSAGYKGDYQSMLFGMNELARAISSGIDRR